MTTLSELEIASNDLVAAATTFAERCRDVNASSNSPQVFTEDISYEMREVMKKVLASMAQLRTLLTQPADFIKNLASQVRESPLSFSEFGSERHSTDADYVESTSCVYTLARRIPGACLHPAQ